jgi:solute carrier family 35 protein F1/2
MRCCHTLKTVLLGQTLAMLIGCTGLFATLLALDGVDMPTVQLSINYLCLSFALLVHAARNGWRIPELSVPWWGYALIALLDLEANYLVTKAYQCTDITSVMLLDCMTIPTCFVLSKIFLRARFVCTHYAGMALCVVGIALIVVSDTAFGSDGNNASAVYINLSASSPSPGTPASSVWSAAAPTTGGLATISVGPNATPPAALPAFCLDSKVVGDVMCLAGSVLYAVSNVVQESIVKKKPIAEFLGMLGVFGFGISVVQIALFERQELGSLDWLDGDNAFYIVGFGVALTSMYVLTSVFLRVADSTFFNISLLFSDVWAVVVTWVLFHTLPQWLYFVAAPFVVSGCVVYSLTTVHYGDHHKHVVGAAPGALVDAISDRDGRRYVRCCPSEESRQRRRRRPAARAATAGLVKSTDQPNGGEHLGRSAEGGGGSDSDASPSSARDGFRRM